MQTPKHSTARAHVNVPAPVRVNPDRAALCRTAACTTSHSFRACRVLRHHSTRSTRPPHSRGRPVPLAPSAWTSCRAPSSQGRTSPRGTRSPPAAALAVLRRRRRRPRQALRTAIGPQCTCDHTRRRPHRHPRARPAAAARSFTPRRRYRSAHAAQQARRCTPRPTPPWPLTPRARAPMPQHSGTVPSQPGRREHIPATCIGPQPPRTTRRSHGPRPHSAMALARAPALGRGHLRRTSTAACTPPHPRVAPRSLPQHV